MPVAPDLETAVATVEQRLGALGQALCSHRAEAVEAEAVGLQRALASAVDLMRRSARAGTLPPPLRQRLALASGHVAAHRESLARATAALDRAIDVLLPGSVAAGAYNAAGRADRAANGGHASA